MLLSTPRPYSLRTTLIEYSKSPPCSMESRWDTSLSLFTFHWRFQTQTPPILFTPTVSRSLTTSSTSRISSPDTQATSCPPQSLTILCGRGTSLVDSRGPLVVSVSSPTTVVPSKTSHCHLLRPFIGPLITKKYFVFGRSNRLLDTLNLLFTP